MWHGSLNFYVSGLLGNLMILQSTQKSYDVDQNKLKSLTGGSSNWLPNPCEQSKVKCPHPMAHQNLGLHLVSCCEYLALMFECTCLMFGAYLDPKVALQYNWFPACTCYFYHKIQVPWRTFSWYIPQISSWLWKLIVN